MKQNVMKDKGQKSSSREQKMEDAGQLRTGSLWLKILGLLLLLTLPAMACGFINTRYQLNNQVRLAVYKYERETWGKPDDLIIDFQRNEPRLKFEGQAENGGRTVWLYRLAAKEFFATRPPEKTYLYIQEIEYNPETSRATVKVFRGDGFGYEGRELTAQQGDDGQWSIINEVKLEE